MMWATGQKVTDKRRPSGFTLLEVMIALAIIGLLLGIAIPTVQSVTAVELKSQARQFRGLVREVYARAVFSGKTHRLVLDLARNSYWVEKSEEEVRLTRLKQEDIENKKEPENSEPKPEEDKKNAEQKFEEKFASADGSLGEKHKLPSGLKWSGVWTDQVQAWVRKGKIALYFFPAG